MCLFCSKVDGNQCNYPKTSCLKCHWHLNLRIATCKTFSLTTRQTWQLGQQRFKLRCSSYPSHVRFAHEGFQSQDRHIEVLATSVPSRNYVISVSSVTNLQVWRMYVTWLNYVCRLKEFTTDFWFHTRHEQWSPEWKCSVNSTSPHGDFLLFMPLLLTSLFAAVITTAATRFNFLYNKREYGFNLYGHLVWWERDGYIGDSLQGRGIHKGQPGSPL